MKINHILLQHIAVVLVYLVLASVITCIMLRIDTGGWTGVDADRFHSMARMIINGFTPYVSFIDPKPPLLYFTVAAMDLLEPAGSLDVPVIALMNVICALIIYRIGKDDYGYVAGFTAGFLYLVVAALVEGYYLFSEQFAVLFLLLAFTFVRRFEYVFAGVFIGLAFGFKQYAILGLIPLLYLMRAHGDRTYYRLVAPAIAIGFSSFGILLLFYGSNATMSALYWTFWIAPTYIGGGAIAEIPSYTTNNLFAFAINLLASIVVVLPTVLFAAASVIKRGLRTPDEWTIVLFALIFSGTLFIRQYLHYWILILPFLALLTCREFADEKPCG